MGLNISKVCCIYAIISLVDNKMYIGSTNDHCQRMRRHKSDLLLNKHHSILLQRHVNKYGFDVLKFLVLEYVENESELIKTEQQYLDLHNPEFNILKIADRPINITRSKETRNKISKSLLGYKHSDKTKKLMSLSQKNRTVYCKHTEETKRKMSEVRLGVKRKPFTVETKKRMSESRPKRKILDTETGIIYEGFKNVPTNFKTSTLEAQLRGQNKNNTNFKLLSKDA